MAEPIRVIKGTPDETRTAQSLFHPFNIASGRGQPIERADLAAGVARRERAESGGAAPRRRSISRSDPRPGKNKNKEDICRNRGSLSAFSFRYVGSVSPFQFRLSPKMLKQAPPRFQAVSR